MTIQFSFDTGTVSTQRIIDAFCTVYNYPLLVDGQPNPETKAAFAKRVVGQMIAGVVRQADMEAAQQQISSIKLT